MWSKLQERLLNAVWGAEPAQLAPLRAFWVRKARLFHATLQVMMEGQLTLRAMSLVYTTLLALVPLLAVSFSVLMAFGVHGQLLPVLENFLAPLGPEGLLLAERIVNFVDNIRVGVLGSLGLAFLIYTVITLIQKVEEAFNFIWRIRRPRTLAQSFTDYLSVLIVGPVLVFSALGVAAAVRGTVFVERALDIHLLGMTAYVLGLVTPFLVVIALFTFVYAFLPNTRVNVRAALVGAISAGLLWELAGWVFASFIAGSARYEAIYSGFAIVIFFMIWLYVSWLILLFGAQLSYYYQHPRLVRPGGREPVLSNRAKERLALMIMFLLGLHYYRGRAPWTLDALVDHLYVPPEAVEDVVDILVRNGLVVETQPRQGIPTYLPVRDIATITVRELLHCVRADGEPHTIGSEPPAPLEGVVAQMDEALDVAMGEETIKDMVLAHEGEADAGSPQPAMPS
ncbi:YihY family inner membrane protein [Ectothiorhodospiraceae bacterium 2226]|nr:YihY family inner membrane protein [Ectothiorhodospiraceae bacterium 2226]